MKTSTMITLATLGLIAFLSLIFLISGIGLYNAEIELRTRVEAKSQERDVVFDNTWKIIQQQAKVSDKYKDAFKEIYPELMGERYKDGESQLAKVVFEANPTFDIKLYEKLMSSIEVQRTIFTRTQKELIDINREHTLLVTKFPNSILFNILSKNKIEIKLVTSDKTKKVIESGEENDIEL